MKRLGLVLMFISPFGLFAQKEVSLGGMQLKYVLKDEYVEIELTAPTTGWLGVGFNSRNDIVGSDLLLFHVVEDEAEALDMYVVTAGNPQLDTRLGGSHNIEILDYEETPVSSKVRFKRPLFGDPRYDYKHQLGDEFWLILAYSTHDEFAHHSRMRQHVRFSFEE